MAVQGAGSKNKSATPVIDADGVIHEEDELAFFKNHGNKIVTLIIIIAIGIALLGIMRNYKTATQTRSAELFNNAETTKDFNELITTFPEAKTIPLARISLGAEHYRAGEFKKAIKTFEGFIAAHPEHEFITNAKLNLAVSQEASGDLKSALAGFKNIADESGHYLRAQAVMGQARILSTQKNYAEAKRVYEDFIATGESKIWVNQAEELLKTVSAKL